MDELQALDRLAAILARPEFQPREQTLWEQVTEAVQDWLFEHLLDLWDRASGAVSGREGALGLVVLLGCVVAFGVLAVFIARGIRMAVVPEGRLAKAQAAARRERSDALWRQAQALATAGQFGEASRAVYLSALYALDEHAVLPVQPGLTNREHAARLRRQAPERSEAFARLVEQYDRLRYGGSDVDAAAYGELRGLAHGARALGGVGVA